MCRIWVFSMNLSHKSQLLWLQTAVSTSKLFRVGINVAGAPCLRFFYRVYFLGRPPRLIRFPGRFLHLSFLQANYQLRHIDMSFAGNKGCEGWWLSCLYLTPKTLDSLLQVLSTYKWKRMCSWRRWDRSAALLMIIMTICIRALKTISLQKGGCVMIFFYIKTNQEKQLFERVRNLIKG